MAISPLTSKKCLIDTATLCYLDGFRRLIPRAQSEPNLLACDCGYSAREYEIWDSTVRRISICKLIGTHITFIATTGPMIP